MLSCSSSDWFTSIGVILLLSNRFNFVFATTNPDSRLYYRLAAVFIFCYLLALLTWHITKTHINNTIAIKIPATMPAITPESINLSSNSTSFAY